MTSRRLTERQVRWSQFLAQFNFVINFRAGKNADRPNALSRRSQDIPKGDDDPRLKEREFQLIKNQWLPTDMKTDNLVAISYINKNIIPLSSNYLRTVNFNHYGIKVLYMIRRILKRYTERYMKAKQAFHPICN